MGTTPEKKIETRITYDVNNMQTDVTVDMHNMLPWLRKVCITSHVISGAEARFHLKFGEDCQQYRIQVSVQSMYRDYYYRETSKDWMSEALLGVLGIRRIRSRGRGRGGLEPTPPPQKKKKKFFLEVKKQCAKKYILFKTN